MPMQSGAKLANPQGWLTTFVVVQKFSKIVFTERTRDKSFDDLYQSLSVTYVCRYNICILYT